VIPARSIARRKGGAISKPHILRDEGGFTHLTEENKLPDDRIAVIRIPVLGDNYTYLLVCGKAAVAVDPGDPGSVLEFLETRGLRLAAVLCTHHHSDHTGGNRSLKASTGCGVYGPADPRIPGLDQPLAEGKRVGIGGDGTFAVQIIAVPGHTRTHVAYRLSAPAVLFSGDCLFPAGCGRVVEGSYAEMFGSLRRLSALPDRTAVLGGHEYTEENLGFALSVEPGSTRVAERRRNMAALLKTGEPPPGGVIVEERETNPFLRSDDPLLKRALGMEGASAIEVFTALRKKKDMFVW